MRLAKWVGSLFGVWRRNPGQSQNQGQKQSQRHRTGVANAHKLIPHMLVTHELVPHTLAPHWHLVLSSWGRLRRRSLLLRRLGWGLWWLSLGGIVSLMILL